MKQKIAIIGGGLSGLSAGVYLAQAGYQVTLFEAAKQLGGRARSITYQNQTLDNGQHICLGAYQSLLDLMDLLKINEEDAFLRLPFEFHLLPHFHLTLTHKRAPWHLIQGIWQAKGINLLERWRLIHIMQWLKKHNYHLTEDQNVLDWLKTHKQTRNLIDAFWTPLCLAALNTPIEIASAQILARVLKESLGTTASSCDLLLPKQDLSQLLPDHAARYIVQHHGEIHTGTRIQSIKYDQKNWYVDHALFNQVIIAVAPHQLAKLTLPTFVETTLAPLQGWSYQAIATLYLQYPPEVQLPHPMQGLINQTAQWIFDRRYTHNQRGLIAVVISAINAKRPSNLLLQQVQDELRTFFQIQSPPLWHKIIIEKRATFSAVAKLIRPLVKEENGLWIAGDYLTPDYPATIESAIKCGKIISQKIREQI